MSELTKFVPPNSSIYSSKSIPKKTVGLTVRQDLLAIARQYGINLSKLLENSLIQLLDPQTNPQTVFGEAFSREKGSVAGPRGIEPLTYGLRVRRSTLLSYGPVALPAILHILNEFIKLT